MDMRLYFKDVDHSKILHVFGKPSTSDVVMESRG